jgi:hypothetical protein
MLSSGVERPTNLAGGHQTNIGTINISIHSYSCLVGLSPITVWTTSGKVCTDLSSNILADSFVRLRCSANVTKINVFQKECCLGQESGGLFRIDKRTLRILETTSLDEASALLLLFRRRFQDEVHRMGSNTPNTPFPRPQDDEQPPITGR